jgi:hypothetical protein
MKVVWRCPDCALPIRLTVPTVTASVPVPNDQGRYEVHVDMDSRSVELAMSAHAASHRGLPTKGDQ